MNDFLHLVTSTRQDGDHTRHTDAAAHTRIQTEMQQGELRNPQLVLCEIFPPLIL